MADPARSPSTDLGPNTEALFARAYAERAVIPANAAAGLIGLDVKTLGALSDAGVIRAVRRGAKGLRGYAERDLRAYLLETGTAPCRVKEDEPRAPSAPRGAKVVLFSAVLERDAGRRR